MSLCVAIDGPAAAGKGTISKALAAHFGFAHLDTGLLYRAVAQKSLQGEDPVRAAQTLTVGDLAADGLRGGDIAQAASRVAADPQVRAALTAFQRGFAAQPGGAVLDGRDIGTVICPDAPVKIFVTASAEARAERRWQELRAAGEDVQLAQVLDDVRRRDARDSGRAAAPLRPAKDAVLLDTSELTADQAIAAAIAIVGRHL